MDLSFRHRETPLSEDSEDEEANEWEDVMIDLPSWHVDVCWQEWLESIVRRIG